MNEHKVWTILKKDMYTEESMQKMEQIYDFLSVMKNTVGELIMKEFFDMWSDYNHETSWILREILNNEALK